MRHDLGPDRPHMFAGRQHRDDRVGTFDCFDAGRGDLNARLARLLPHGRHEIEAPNRMPGLD